MSTNLSAVNSLVPEVNRVSERVSLTAIMSEIAVMIRGRRTNSVLYAFAKSVYDGLERLPAFVGKTIIVGGVTMTLSLIVLSQMRAGLERKHSRQQGLSYPVLAKSVAKKWRTTLDNAGNRVVTEVDMMAPSYDTVDTVFVGSSAELVSYLRPYSMFRERNYTLLMSLTMRATHWINSLPDEYGVDKRERWKLIPGSVAEAIRVTSLEDAARLKMLADKSYEKTKGWDKGVPKLGLWDTILHKGFGGLGEWVLGRNTGLGPRTK